jgi:hypothetical protein
VTGQKNKQATDSGVFLIEVRFSSVKLMTARCNEKRWNIIPASREREKDFIASCFVAFMAGLLWNAVLSARARGQSQSGLRVKKERAAPFTTRLHVFLFKRNVIKKTPQRQQPATDKIMNQPAFGKQPLREGRAGKNVTMMMIKEQLNIIIIAAAGGLLMQPSHFHDWFGNFSFYANGELVGCITRCP